MHLSVTGARRYRLLVPDGPARGLLILLHGCKQGAADIAAISGIDAVAAERRLIVACPEQSRMASWLGAWRWFEPSHQRRGAGEPELLASLARKLCLEFGLPLGSAYAAGLSAGGAMAAILGHTYPDLFDAVGIHSGLAPGAARSVPQAYDAMEGRSGDRPRAIRARTFIIHGDADARVVAANASAIFHAAPPGQGQTVREVVAGGRRCRVTAGVGARGHEREMWLVAGAGHSWIGGAHGWRHSDPMGPSATRCMMNFFLRETSVVRFPDVSNAPFRRDAA